MMDSHGRPTSFPPKRSESAKRYKNVLRRACRHIFLRIIATTLWFGSVAACAPTVEYGVRPKTDALAKLTAAESTKEDIRLVLGEPRGRGVARFSQDPIPRNLWYYEYIRSDGQTIDLKVLIVLLKNDVYDGHFWFSSVDVLEVME